MPFHISHAWLDVGSVIMPGNWGRVVSAHGYRHNLALRESVLEEVRRLEFPGLPSRLASAFYLETLEGARAYRQNQNMQLVNTYEVERVAADAVEAKADFRRVQPVGALGFDWARAYWRGEGFPEDALNGIDPNLYLETLSVSPLRVVRLVSQE